jgi:Na+-transporting methylmalonyl-CoA/oxaloacetate decarboxylase gamma subunit
MNDSAIRLIGEVLLRWGMGVVDVLLLLVWRYDLYFLVVLVCVVRGCGAGAWMYGGGGC